LLSRGGFESHDTPVVVTAGSTTDVAIGGTGRAVLGKVFLPGAAGRVDWQTVDVRLRLKTGDEPGPRPHRADFPSNEGYIAAADHFFAAARAQRRYGALCDSTGRFHVSDVPAGHYELTIQVRDYKLDSASPGQSVGMTPPELGSLTREIIVPETPESQAAEPLDLGALQLVPAQHTSLK
jgi:hypothetical protein